MAANIDAIGGLLPPCHLEAFRQPPYSARRVDKNFEQRTNRSSLTARS